MIGWPYFASPKLNSFVSCWTSQKLSFDDVSSTSLGKSTSKAILLKFP